MVTHDAPVMRLSLTSGPAGGALEIPVPEKRPPTTHDFESDVAMVRSAVAEGPDGFFPIFRRYSKPLLVFIYGLIGDRQRAEELTQETFIRAFYRLETLREDYRLSTWIFGIARNVVREAIREKYRKVRRAALHEDADTGIPDTRLRPDESIIAEELHSVIQTAVTNLPEDQRIAFVLKLILDLRYEEISEITGSSIGKLKTDLHRARQRLRDQISPYMQGGLSRKRGDQ
jgi:RNA polymerase sigma-70 factor, ECF subfamily